MLNAVRLYYFVFAALTFAGGLMGFLKAGSKASLIAGGVSGLLLALAAFLLAQKTTAGLAVGFTVSLLLFARFLGTYLKKGAPMPAIPMIVLGVIGVALSVAAFMRR